MKKPQQQIKTVEKKLVLVRSKIRDLTGPQLDEVAGGSHLRTTGGCWYSFDSK
jgi:hypothetical protein